MSQRDEKFIEFTGVFAIENDGGWSKEVWDTAWNEALEYAACKIQKLSGDTAASFGVFVRDMKE